FAMSERLAVEHPGTRQRHACRRIDEQLVRVAVSERGRLSGSYLAHHTNLCTPTAEHPLSAEHLQVGWFCRPFGPEDPAAQEPRLHATTIGRFRPMAVFPPEAVPVVCPD